MGYYQAGFDVIGVDIDPQPRYPFQFIQGDVFEVWGSLPHDRVSAYHASPMCQGFTPLNSIHKNDYPNQIPHTRRLLQSTGKPYAIENVPEAPLINPIVLCGTMFGLDILRHRAFETYPVIWFPPATCNHYKPVVKCGRKPDLAKEFHSIYGHFSGVPEAQEAMGINWMTQDGLREAIPPAYTKFIGSQLLKAIQELRNRV